MAHLETGAEQLTNYTVLYINFSDINLAQGTTPSVSAKKSSPSGFVEPHSKLSKNQAAPSRKFDVSCSADRDNNRRGECRPGTDDRVRYYAFLDDFTDSSDGSEHD